MVYELEKEHKKSSLMCKKKEELVKEIMRLEHNVNVMNERLNNQANAIKHYEQESRNKAIEEFAEKLKYELNGNIIPDNEKFTYARKQQEQICHQNMTLKRAIKYVDYIAEQLKGGAE